MDMKEWIIIGGGALIGLIVLHGLFMAWWRGRDPLRMKIQPGLLPEDADEDAWLSAELPNGGARVVSAESTDLDAEVAVDADEGVPVLLETAGSRRADEAESALDGEPASEAEGSPALGNPLPDMAPIVPERGLGSAREKLSKPSGRVELDEDAGASDIERTGPEADQPPLEQAAFLDADLEPMPESATLSDDSDPGAEAADDLLVVHLVAPQDETFSGEALVSALRAQDLRFGEMSIFHRLDDATGEAVFSVVRAVEPGSFDLTHIEDCASPGLMAFLRLPTPGDAENAVEDMMRTVEAMADDLGGELLDDNRKPFTALSPEGYRSRALGFADRQAVH